MTLQEFFNSKEKLAIHCDTKEKANRLLKAFDRLGEKWLSGESYLELNCWYIHEKNTCYSNDNMYCEEQYYKKKRCRIIEFEDIDLGENKMKKKLRDWTSEEIDEYCRSHRCCGECPLKVNKNEYLCNLYKNYKNYLNDKTLNIELDIPFKEILDKEDKETLIYHCLLLKRERRKISGIVKAICFDSDFAFIKFYFCDKSDRNDDYLCLPAFKLKYNAMFSNMELDKVYTPQDLGIDLDKYELVLKEK